MTDPAPAPTPGSDAAIAAGCLCPVTNNNSGAGYVVHDGVVTYWRNPACPMHGAASGYTVLRDYSPAAEWDA